MTLVRHEFVLVERLRAAQADLEARSRAEERNRIARELHDVIAHSLTVSLLHLSSARLAVEHDDPADAARALAEAERLGRQSLAEVRATMGVLHADPTRGITPPVPGVDQLPRLVEQLRGAGADVSLAVGRRRRLPATTGSTVYRIVQEALTNATRHAPGSAVPSAWRPAPSGSRLHRQRRRSRPRLGPRADEHARTGRGRRRHLHRRARRPGLARPRLPAPPGPGPTVIANRR